MTVPLPPFTLVGATTRAGLLTIATARPLRRLPPAEHYSAEAPGAGHVPPAAILVEIDTGGAETIASRLRGTPRVANRLLKRVRDFPLR